ncbi:MAG: TIGR00341 family protein [Candidatus Kapaibacteriales bacterium]
MQEEEKDEQGQKQNPDEIDNQDQEPTSEELEKKKQDIEKIKKELVTETEKKFEDDDSDESEGDPDKKSGSEYFDFQKSVAERELDGEVKNFDEYYSGDSGRQFEKPAEDRSFSTSFDKKAALSAALEFLRRLVSLDDDKANEQQTIDQIKRNVVFRGTNLWILIFAIIVASVGLNVNSAAVIIGAMLISPLMGPIMGIGMGVGINDLALIRKAAKNLFVAAFISVLTSAVYFSITPLSDAHSELLARTTPTIFDVFIAFFGGLAGIVAGSRSEKSNAIPGVAIATALMPPLCTAGYGLANGNFEFFFGAFYLFFINSVFIAISTFIIVRYLKYPKKQFADPKVEKKVKMYVTVIAVATLIPSIFFAYNTVTKSLFMRKASEFVREEVTFPSTYILNSEYDVEGEDPRITLTLYGKPLDQDQIQMLQAKMSKYDLPESCELVIRQNQQDGSLTEGDVMALNASIRQDLMNDLFNKNEEELQSKEETIQQLKEELVDLKMPVLLSKDLLQELKVNYPRLDGFSASYAQVYSAADTSLRDTLGNQLYPDGFIQDTVLLAYADFNGKEPKRDEREKLKEWLKVRMKKEKLRLIIE